MNPSSIENKYGEMSKFSFPSIKFMPGGEKKVSPSSTLVKFSIHSAVGGAISSSPYTNLSFNKTIRGNDSGLFILHSRRMHYVLGTTLTLHINVSVQGSDFRALYLK
jgi:hypothetical protein